MHSQKLSIVIILTPFSVSAVSIFLCERFAFDISVAYSNSDPLGCNEDIKVSVEGLCKNTNSAAASSLFWVNLFYFSILSNFILFIKAQATLLFFFNRSFFFNLVIIKKNPLLTLIFTLLLKFFYKYEPMNSQFLNALKEFKGTFSILINQMIFFLSFYLCQEN